MARLQKKEMGKHNGMGAGEDDVPDLGEDQLRPSEPEENKQPPTERPLTQEETAYL